MSVSKVEIHVAADRIHPDGTLVGSLYNCARLEDAIQYGTYVHSTIRWVDDVHARDFLGHPFRRVTPSP